MNKISGLQLIKSTHCISLNVIGNINIGSHRLVVAVSRPFHYNLCRDTECQRITDKCASSSMSAE